MRGVLIDQGNGLPGAGAYVLDRDGNLYRVLSTTGHILTAEPGQGNRMHCEVERADWSGCPDGAEHSARVEVVA